ncbi:O-antigen ligase family protein [Rhodococcus sp. 14-2483-1-2]|uniref:O-antigen ligase family protein n=1 Tax=Rhodococcus sp. 14-2483-1-2 TaxID=2023147 RepID=UPI000B9B5B83|nr:O-antigen ligase family protein [Rhodococcus sp. 14-2483-1-2]OZF37321.1 hypothetical protein CH295_06530 [Rhodococcus sp. 14-2483-1-2]
MTSRATHGLAFASLYLGVLIFGAVGASKYWMLPLAAAGGLAVLTLCSMNRGFAWAVYFFAVTANGLVVSAGFGTLRPELLALPVLVIILLQQRSNSCSLSNSKIPRPLLVSAAIWLLVTVLSSSFVAPEHLRSIWICLQIVAAVGTYFALSNSSEKDLFFRSGTIIISSIAALSIALYLASKIGGIYLPLEYGVAEDGRLIGLSFEVNVFAAQCVGWLAVMFANRNIKMRLQYPMVLILAIAVLLSGTRAAWIALALISCLTIVDFFRRGKISQSMGMCIAALLGSLYVFSGNSSLPNDDDFAWRVSNIFNVSQGTGAYRLDIYSMALADVDGISRWLFGSGANSFSQYHPIDTTGTGAPYLSSVWAAVPYDSGIIGFLAFIGLIYGCVYRFANRWSGLVVPATLLICSSTTNTVWFAFTWVYIAMVAVRVGAQEENISDHDQQSAGPNQILKIQSKQKVF